MNNLNFKMNRCSHCLVGILYVRLKKLAKLGNQIKVDSTPDDHKFTNIFQFLMVLLFFSLSTTNYSFIIIIIFWFFVFFLSCYEIFVFQREILMIFLEDILRIRKAGY